MVPAIVIYYSLTGNTRQVARVLAERLSADIQEITEPTSRQGLKGLFRSIWQARGKRLAPILPLAVDPSRYRLAIIGTPVWAFSMASPVRSFLVDYREKLPRVAFFCTLRSSGSASVFQEMEQAAGQKPLACLTVKDREVTSNSFTEATEKFAVALLTWLKG